METLTQHLYPPGVLEDLNSEPMDDHYKALVDGSTDDPCAKYFNMEAVQKSSSLQYLGGTTGDSRNRKEQAKIMATLGQSIKDALLPVGKELGALKTQVRSLTCCAKEPGPPSCPQEVPQTGLHSTVWKK